MKPLVTAIVERFCSDVDESFRYFLAPIGENIMLCGQFFLARGPEGWIVDRAERSMSKLQAAKTAKGLASRGLGMRSIALIEAERAAVIWEDDDSATLARATIVTIFSGTEFLRRCGRALDLGGADLRGVELRGADLSDSNLKDADLRGADLERVKLKRANLSSADLQGCNLFRANLFGATLERADLRRSSLRHAELRESKLAGAVLRGADLWAANIWQVDLTGVSLDGVDVSRADTRGS